MVLREEDKFDKQTFKEKVKAKHKEEKRKLKEQKKREQEAERDEFGESEDDEGNVFIILKLLCLTNIYDYTSP